MGALGPEMASLYGHLKTLTELKGQISYSGVASYPAVAVPSKFEDLPGFLLSLGDIGTIELIKDYARELEMCPDTKFIIAGYSQGAYAAHYLLDQLQRNKSYLRDSIVGVILLASPTQDKTGIISILKDDTKNTKDFKIFLKIFFEKINFEEINLEKVLTETYNIAPADPKFLKPMPFYTPNDVVADTSRFLAGSISDIGNIVKLATNPQEYKKRISTRWNFAATVHSGYCAKSGKYAPKDPEKLRGCNEKANKAFLAQSEKYIKGQLSELKRLNNLKRQNVLSWYGKDWVVPTNCGQTMTRNFSRLQEELSYEFEDNGALRLRILALNAKDSSIWFVNEVNSELVSYNAEDGLYSLEELEKSEKLFEILGSFSEGFKDLSKRGLISNLVFDPEENWRCKVDLGMTD
jgi:pimeloyl-ACP methyl ester carboxylesterase